MPTEKQEDLDQRDDDELDIDMDEEELDIESEDDAAAERARQSSPMGEALDAEDAKKGDVHIDDETVEDDDFGGATD